MDWRVIIALSSFCGHSFIDPIYTYMCTRALEEYEKKNPDSIGLIASLSYHYSFASTIQQIGGLPTLFSLLSHHSTISNHELLNVIVKIARQLDKSVMLMENGILPLIEKISTTPVMVLVDNLLHFVLDEVQLFALDVPVSAISSFLALVLTLGSGSSRAKTVKTIVHISKARCDHEIFQLVGDKLHVIDSAPWLSLPLDCMVRFTN